MNSQGRVVMRSKKHCNFRQQTVTFEHRDENKSCSACRVSTGPGCKARARLMSCAAYAKNLRGGSGIQLTSYSATPVQCRRAVLQALRHSDNSLKKYWKNTKKKIWTGTGNSGVVCEDKSGCKGLENWAFVTIDFFCVIISCVFRLYSPVSAEKTKFKIE